eukprot:jgi/Chrpa1/12238/Chrysochromulina_OHIO_Genome00004985-RA
MLTTTSAKLSLTSLVAYLRESLPRERHAALDAVWAELTASGAPMAGGIQQRLWEVAGKEAVQAAILHLVQAPSALQATAPIPTDAEPELAPAIARSEGLPHLGHELAHAAACTDSACGQPNCQRMKAKFFKLSSHAASCTEAKCTPCSIWGALCRQRDRVGHDAVCAPDAAEIKLEKEPTGADSFVIRGAKDSAASASGAAPAAEPAADGACRGAGADAAPCAASTFDGEPPEKHTARRELLAHVFTCLQPSCSFPRCARLRRRLHTLVPHASTCTLARCEQCEIWHAYNDCLARTFAARQEALCGGALSPHALSTLAGIGGAGSALGVRGGGEDLAPSLQRSLSASHLGSAHRGGGPLSNFGRAQLGAVLHAPEFAAAASSSHKRSKREPRTRGSSGAPVGGAPGDSGGGGGTLPGGHEMACEAAAVGQRWMIKTAAVADLLEASSVGGLGGCRAAVGSVPEWLPARVLQVCADRLLVQAESGTGRPPLLPRWVPLPLSGGPEGALRPMDPADVAASALEEAAASEDSTFEEGCLVDVESEANESGWRAAVVLGRDPTSRLYNVRLEGGAQDGARVGAIRHASLRLRCADPGCRKHALQMQRPPRDCGTCGRALQHPMRSYWEWTADMAEALRAGVSSAQLCAACHKQACVEAAAAWGAPQPPRRGAPVALDPRATVCVGKRTLPLAAFVEVQITRRRDLDTEAPEDSEQQNWVQCETCREWVHWVCALYNHAAHLASGRAAAAPAAAICTPCQPPPASSTAPFVCRGCRARGQPAHEAAAAAAAAGEVDASALPECTLSRALEAAVASALDEHGVLAEPVRVRVASSIDLVSTPNDVMRQRQWSDGQAYPTAFPFRSRAVMAMQKVEGHEVLLFMMYTQEYGDACPEPNTRRVYISYVDSVKYLRTEPAGHRSTVYRALLAAYLASCRRRGFRHIHLWVEPPRAGDEYIFFARPPDERRPMKREKLRSWYVKMLELARRQGTVLRYGDMLDEFRDITSAREIPLFKGDQWEITVPALLEAKDEADELSVPAPDGAPANLSRAPAHECHSPADAVKVHTDAAALVARQQSLRRIDSDASEEGGGSGIGLGGAGGRSMRLKGLQMCKSISADLVAQVRKQMRHMAGHFLVATLAPLEDGEAPELQLEPPRSCEVANTRQALLQFSQAKSLQFNSLRFAQYSTMCLLWEVLHPAPKPEGGGTEGGGTYCVPGCRRGRLDDGSVMIGCDVCDGWYHPGCLMQPPENADDPFVCPICVEGKAESYLSSTHFETADPFGDFLRGD